MTITREEWDNLSPQGQWEYIRATEQVLAERQRLLESIPKCPIHGECVPHAIDWVRQQLLRRVINGWKGDVT